MSIFRSRRRKGAVLVFVAICLMVLFGFAALAIDLSYHRTLQLQAQNAADSAAYAGMVSLRESGDRPKTKHAVFKPFILCAQNAPAAFWAANNRSKDGILSR